NLKDHFGKEIREIKIADQKWQKNHWQAIELNYKKAKYWPQYYGKLKKNYENEYDNISDLCYGQLILFLDFLEAKTKVVKTSELRNYQTKKLDIVLEILKDLNTEIYVSGALGRDYVDANRFKQQNIKLYFQDYQHPTHHQLWGEFAPYMSVIDLLFNEGPKSKEIIFRNNISKDDLSRTF
ncbi:MAG TPA: WbqC family protein, partial [Patescibacteria group bacterium]|nr:WbqC family protein [Patescibacteria group bacterium]